MEMEAVANIFDRDGDGYINYKEFVAALRPDNDVSLSFSDSLHIFHILLQKRCGGIYIFLCALDFALT